MKRYLNENGLKKLLPYLESKGMLKGKVVIKDDHYLTEDGYEFFVRIDEGMVTEPQPTGELDPEQLTKDAIGTPKPPISPNSNKPEIDGDERLRAQQEKQKQADFEALVKRLGDRFNTQFLSRDEWMKFMKDFMRQQKTPNLPQ